MQVPKKDVLEYSERVTEELYAPLEASYRGDLDGDPHAIPLIILCETILSTFHSICTLGMPYPLLKSYGIAPLKSGTMARDGRLSLGHCARVNAATGLLQIPADLVDRVFLVQSAVEAVPRGARREIFDVLDFLGRIKHAGGGGMEARAAGILVDKLLEEYVGTRVVERRAVLKSSRELVKSGCTIHSIVTARSYASRAFARENVSGESSVYAFLRIALDLIPEDTLHTHLAKALLDRCSFLPRITVHGSPPTVSASVFQVLATRSFASVREQVRST